MLLKNRRLQLYILGMVSLLMIGACNRYRYTPENEPPKLPCKVEGACDATVAKYLTKFQRRGIKVVTIGQDYMVSLPAYLIFDDQSPHMKWSGYKVLNEVADFLKQFRKIAVSVNSYSSPYVSAHREHALTIARSRVVSEYLWNQGVDSRFIFSQGLGSEKPISNIKHGGDKSPNARIEIVFRRAILN